MVILGVAVFIAGLLMLYSAITDQKITELMKGVFGAGQYPVKEGN